MDNQAFGYFSFLKDGGSFITYIRNTIREKVCTLFCGSNHIFVAQDHRIYPSTPVPFPP